MRIDRPLALGLMLALSLCSCSVPEEPAPDVLLISVDRLDWEELSVAGGPVVTPALAAWAESATVFDGMVSLAPGGAPAAATLLTGAAPSSHGVRWLAGERDRLEGGTLAETFAAKGYSTAAFLDVGLFGGGLQVDRGFAVWDQPPLGFPTGQPGHALQRRTEVTATSAKAWLRVQEDESPLFLWIHLAEPAGPRTPVAERDDRLARLDTLVAELREVFEARGERRGAEPVSCLVNLADHGADPAQAAAEAFVMDERALRVHALCSAPGLPTGRFPALAGVDELSAFLAGQALGTESRLADLARGFGRPRGVVLAESMVPFSTMGAEPVMVAVRSRRPANDGRKDVAVAQALAADSEWPGGGGLPSARESLADYLVLDRAWDALRSQEDVGKAIELFTRFTSAERPPPAARVGHGLALLVRGKAGPASEQFRALEATAAPASVHWRQALLGQAHASWRSGDLPGATTHLGRLLARSDQDIEALWWLGEIKASLAEEAEALGALQRVIDLDPDHPDALVTAARLGSGRLAAETFDQALGRRPVDPGLLLEAAAAWASVGEFQTALWRIELHVRAHGPGLENSLALAAVHQASERWADAAKAYLAALHHDPLSIPPRLRLAETLLKHSLMEPHGAPSRVESAMAHLEHVRRRAPGDPGPCLVSCSYLIQAGPEAEARAEVERCRRAHPEDPSLRVMADGLAGEAP